MTNDDVTERYLRSSFAHILSESCTEEVNALEQTRTTDVFVEQFCNDAAETEQDDWLSAVKLVEVSFVVAQDAIADVREDRPFWLH